MTIQLRQHSSRNLLDLVRLERRAFAAKLRMVRGVLGLSQSAFANRIGLTQRAIHKLEQGETEPRRTTIRAIVDFWRKEGLEFEDLADGGFSVCVRSSLFGRSRTTQSRPRRAARAALGFTAIGHRSPTYRS